MAIVALVKPATIAGDHIWSGGGSAPKVGPNGSRDFYIKIRDADYDTYSPVEEVTGDGDVQPKFENNLFLYMNFKWVGAMPAVQAIGLKNLVSHSATTGVTDKNPVGGQSVPQLITSDFGLYTTGKKELMFHAIIERIFIRMRRSAVYIPVLMQGKMTDMTSANIAGMESSA